jgi:hypothetical protein
LLEQVASPQTVASAFPGKFFVTADAFTLGQVLNFGSLAYVDDCYGKHHPRSEAAPVSHPKISILGCE